MQTLTTTLNLYFPWLTLIGLLLVYVIYQIQQMRAQLKAAEARCNKHESTIETLCSEEITTLEEQLQQLQTERDQVETRYATLEQTHNSQLQNYEQLQVSYDALTAERDQVETRYATLEQEHNSQLQNYEQLQVSYDALTAERDRLKAARKKPRKTTARKKKTQAVRRDYLSDLINHLKEHPNITNKTAIAEKLDMSITTLNKYLPQAESALSATDLDTKSVQVDEPESTPQLMPAFAD